MATQASPKGYQYVRPVPAYRPRRTRSKTGCLCCRLRRKKCDERKPVCRRCETGGLTCSWSDDAGSRQNCANIADPKRATAVEQVHRGVCIPTSISAEPSAPATPEFNFLLQLDDENAGALCAPALHRAPPEEFLEAPCASLLLEHFVAKTSHTLVGRDALRNPFLYSVLPVMYSNPLVMHAVLAISGIHMKHYARRVDVERATYAHYGMAVAQLKARLVTWVGSSDEETTFLFHATILLCIYEAMEGDANGNMAHHLRACTEFARHIVASEADHTDNDLVGVSLEVYVYLALLAYLEGPSSRLPSSSSDHLLSTLDHLRNYRTFGSLLGCAHRLYELIPEVSDLVWCRRRRSSGSDYQSTDEAYEALKTRIESWPDETDTGPGSPGPLSETSAEYAAGVMIRNTLLMLLHHSQIFGRPALKQAMTEKIQPLVDDNMAFLDVLSDAPVANVSLWLLVVTGSMMQKSDQKQCLAQRLKSHHSQTPVASRAVEILTWIWNDPEKDSYGLYGVAKVASEHMTHICLT